jgi:CubicO group peptidase (beta-lactamase class C family)
VIDSPVEPMSFEVVGAEAVGIDPDRLSIFLARAELEVAQGVLPSAQVAVARHGQLAAFETFGEGSPDRRYILQSVGRTVVAAVVWKLLGEGLLDLDERVAEIIPEFGTNGKDAVTVRHLLTHTGGFPFAPLGYPRMLDREARIEAFSRWRLDSTPGSRLQFHLTGAAWVIAELVDRRTGSSFADYLREQITKPLGLGLVLPVPADRYDDLLAAPVAIDRTSDDQKVDPWGPWYLADPQVLAAGEPSHSIAGTAADVAMLFQALYHSSLWDPVVVTQATEIHVSAPPFGDRLYGGSDEIANLGLFCCVAGEAGGSWTPRTGSPATFGNSGAPCQLGFMDPETGASFAFLTNGYPLAGYDNSRQGHDRIVNLANLGNELVRR